MQRWIWALGHFSDVTECVWQKEGVPVRSAKKTPWKKHQVGIWQMPSLQQHPDTAVSTGGLTRIMGLCQSGKTMDCNFICSNKLEEHF